MSGEDAVEQLEVSAYTIPTDLPEADGTLAWDSTTLVLCQVRSRSGIRGVGYTYCSAAAATVAHSLQELVVGIPVDHPGKAWDQMLRKIRNQGRPGVVACAISAIDVALWDLRARVAGLPLFRLLGAHRDSVPIYGSGGFTSYTDQQLTAQLESWAQQGIPRVKIKIATDWGSRPELDLHRIGVAREAIGPETELYVDANGAYAPKRAIRLGRRFAEDFDVSYLEEPVSSDHLTELAGIRRAIAPDVAAGEYGYDPWYFRDLLRSEAVDVMQADASRCLGVSGWLEAAALAHSFGIPFSGHCMPSVHAQLGCVAPEIAHIEYFHTHARIEGMLFDGTLDPAGGALTPDPSRPGLGLEPKPSELERHSVA